MVLHAADIASVDAEYQSVMMKYISFSVIFHSMLNIFVAAIVNELFIVKSCKHCLSLAFSLLSTQP